MKFLIIFTTLLATSTARIQNVRPRLGFFGHGIKGELCLSWRLGVETNNVVEWATIPMQCEGYVGRYMLGPQYIDDSEIVVNQAIGYANSLAKHSNNAWVLDVDETSLSNLPYYAAHGFGAEPFNLTAYNAWVSKGKAPALRATLRLYRKLLSLKVKIVFLTGRTEDQRAVTEANMKRVGFHTWEMFLLKGPQYLGKTDVAYKSSERKKLETNGYRIIGNIGDQWSDILGTNTGNRTFKFPNPMYYIS